MDDKVYEIKFDVDNAAISDLRKIDRGVDKVGDSAEKAAKKVKSIGDRLETAGKKISGFGKKLSIGFTAPIVAAGAASLKFAMDLNKGMANVSTLLSGGTKQVEALKRGVQDLSVETGKSTTDLADGLYNVVSALGESSENMGQLDTVARAAVAGVSTTTEALDFLSSVTKAYGDSSQEAMKKASDLGFMTVKLGKTTFPELAASMGKVTPLAATLKTSQEELFAAFATLTGVTGNTAEVSTQLSAVYSAMLKPTDTLSAAVQKLGFSSASAMIKERGFIESVKLLGEASGGSEDKLAKMLGRKEALLPVLALLGEQSDDYNRKLREIEGSLGATNEAFDKQTKGINKQGHSWEQTKARFVVFAQRIGDKLLPILDRLFRKFEPWLEQLEKMDDATLEWWMKWIGVHAAIGPVLTVVGSMTSKIGLLHNAMSAANMTTRAMQTSTMAMGGAMQANTGKVKGMTRAMKGLAALGVITVGVELAMMAKHATERHSQEQAEAQDELRNAIRHAREVARRKGGATFEEKTAALERLQAAKGYAPQTLKSAEGVAGTALHALGMAEHPAQRLMKNIEQANIEEKRLRAGIQGDISGMRSARKQAESAEVQAALINPLARGAIGKRVGEAVGGAQGGIQINDNKKITFSGMGAHEVATEMKKIVNEGNRDLAERIRDESRNVGPKEF